MQPNSPSQHCLSCGGKLHGKYCSLCGEKVLDKNELSLQHVLGNLLNAFTFAESKLFKTIAILFKQPGRLSLDWTEGRRVKWMRPVAFFFMLNFLYFLFPMFQTFNTNYYNQVSGQNYSRWIVPLAEEKRSSLKLNIEEFAKVYNAESASYAKLLIVVFVFIQSLFLLLIFAFSKRFYAEHLAFAFEWSSFNLLVNAILLWLLALLLFYISGWFGINLNGMNDNTYSLIAMITNMAFMYLGGRLFYRLAGIRLILFSAASVFILFGSLLAYRLMLFLVTIYTL